MLQNGSKRRENGMGKTEVILNYHDVNIYAQ
jgi:hypothetical protein